MKLNKPHELYNKISKVIKMKKAVGSTYAKEKFSKFVILFILCRQEDVIVLKGMDDRNLSINPIVE